jgi:hypothetical protein
MILNLISVVFGALVANADTPCVEIKSVPKGTIYEVSIINGYEVINNISVSRGYQIFHAYLNGQCSVEQTTALIYGHRWLLGGMLDPAENSKNESTKNTLAQIQATIELLKAQELYSEQIQNKVQLLNDHLITNMPSSLKN